MSTRGGSLLLLSAMFVSACGSADSVPEPTGSAAPQVTEGTATGTPAPGTSIDVPGVTPGPAATDGAGAEEINAEGDVALGPGPFDFPEPQAGLASLSSYRASVSLSFAGTQTGQPSQWSRTYVMTSTLEPLARQVTIESIGQTAEPEPLFMAEMNGAAYEQRGDGACTASVIEAGQTLSEQMEPATFLTGVFGADEAGAETVNGVTANHYTFDERALGEAGVATSVGELWVATDGVLVKYSLTTTGGADYFGEGIEGVATWAYELTDVNEPLVVELPADCPAGIIDAPLLPDAADVLNEPGVVSYDTASTPADAASFYEDELSARGWQPKGEGVVTEAMALRDFTRDDQQLSLVITAGENGTTVLITAGPVEPAD